MNATTKHTPGPLRLVRADMPRRCGMPALLNDAGEVVAYVPSEPLAHMFAAAPDLLAALIRLVNAPDVNADMLSPETIVAADHARAAIAKAQGGAL